MDLDGILALLLFAGLIVGLILLTKHKEKKHGREVQDYARQRGWRYSHEDRSVESRFKDVPPFAGARRPRYRNIVRHWSGGYTGYSFDFTEMSLISDADARNRSHYHVISIDLPVAAPTLLVRPEVGGQKVTEALGILDIQFESAAFNERWYVKSTDKEFTSHVIHPLMIEWLMEPRQRSANFTIVGDSCFMILPGRQNPRRIDGRVDHLAEFAGRIPQFVWDNLSD